MTLNKVLYILVSQTVNEQKDQTEMSLLHKLPVCSWLRLQCERSHLLAYKKASSNLVLEIIWQATERWSTRLSVFPIIWSWTYSFMLTNTHPNCMFSRPRMSNSAGQLNKNIHALFPQLSGFSSWWKYGSPENNKNLRRNTTHWCSRKKANANGIHQTWSQVAD